MLQFLRCLLAIYAIATMSFVWAGCPEGQKQNDRTGECALIPGWTGADQSAKEKLMPASSSSTAENKQSLAAGQTGRISFSSPPFMGLKQFLEGGGGGAANKSPWLPGIPK